MTNTVINDFEIYSAPRINVTSEGAIEVFLLTSLWARESRYG